MTDIDIPALIETLLADRHLRESSAFSEHTYASELLQTGRQLQERQASAAARHERDRARQDERAEARAARRLRHRARHGRGASSSAGIGDPTMPLWMYELDAPARRPKGEGYVPKRYRQMRELAREAAGQLPMSSPKLFFRQATFMADYEDDYPQRVGFSHYYPTYAAMDIVQLRSYFSWRTKLRAGTVEPTSLSFAFLHVYELLCGVGTSPGRQGYRDLVSFWEAFAPHALGTSFDSLLRRWTHDYAIYHDIVDVLVTTVDGGGIAAGATGVPAGAHGAAPSFGDAVATLIDAEEAVLARASRARKVAQPTAAPAMPVADDLFAAVAAVSRYHIERSRFAKDHHDDIVAIVGSVFEALVLHCSRRRKTDYVEGLFGYPKDEAYVMYPSAVFYDPVPPDDGTVVSLGRAESYRRELGRWWRHLSYRREETSRELGCVLRAVDSRARERFAYGHPIKVPKAPPAYVVRIIDAAVDERLAFVRAREARRITIDRKKLQGIRDRAATTREALLVDDEREPATTSPGQLGSGMKDIGTRKPEGTNTRSSSEKGFPYNANKSAILETDVSARRQEQGLFNELELTVIEALLAGRGGEVEHVVAQAGGMASLVIDAINDKLFDVVGDAVIELVGNVPAIVAEYEPDVREAVGNG